MQLTSGAFTDNDILPARYSYHGGNARPPLAFHIVPPEAKSLVVICHDPDSPTANGYVHWVVWNIPPNVTELTEKLIADKAIQGLTDWGTKAWGGPAPHAGTHHYNFYLYALDTMLDLPLTANKVQLESAMVGHIIEQTALTGLYSAS